MPQTDGLFFPGFGARARAYSAGLPVGWQAFQPPPLHVSRGSVSSLREWAVREVRRHPAGVMLGGHSMGAALAILAAATAPEHVQGLLLLAPAGLPLSKPVRTSAGDFVGQLARRTYPLADVVAGARDLAASPRGFVRLARTLRRLDLSVEMGRVRRAGIPTRVVACSSDTLVTPGHCRVAAEMLGAAYDEVDHPGGHVWVLRQPTLLDELVAATPD